MLVMAITPRLQAGKHIFYVPPEFAVYSPWKIPVGQPILHVKKQVDMMV
jgi:hypothetical protein